jgi:hypothetical protein
VLKAVWQDSRIDAVVSEMTNFDQLEQNVAAALDRTRLGALELDSLRHHAEATEHLYCQGCEQHCRPTLARPVRVADTLRLLMYHDEYGEPERARRLFAAIPPEERALGEVDFAPAARACPRPRRGRLMERAAGLPSDRPPLSRRAWASVARPALRTAVRRGLTCRASRPRCVPGQSVPMYRRNRRDILASPRRHRHEQRPVLNIKVPMT